MPVAIAAFFATRFSFAPVLRTTPFADLLVFFDEVPDFLRLALFMNASRSTRFVQVGRRLIEDIHSRRNHSSSPILTINATGTSSRPRQ
jgi:hypothetical protein